MSGDGASWSQPQIVPGTATSDSTSLAWDGSQVWMVWKGVPGDQGLYFARWNLVGRWGQVGNIGGTGSNFAPSVAVVGLPPGPGSQLVPMMASKGVDGDSQLYAANFVNGAWTPQNQNPIPGVGTSDKPAVAVDPVTGEPR